MKEPVAVISFSHVSKTFLLNRKSTIKHYFGKHLERLAEIQALLDVSFTIQRGETVGLYGPNGSGKSTILKLAAGILVPDNGCIHTLGSIAPVLELGSGLHPDLNCRDNIVLCGTILGTPISAIYETERKIISFAGLSKFVHLPVKKYSSGMRARLAFSIAIHSPADTLLIDEALSIGDIEFQTKGLKALRTLKKKRTIVFTSHSLSFMQQFCDRVLFMEGGVLQNEKNQEMIGVLRSSPPGFRFQGEIQSNSMYPVLRKGDAVTIQRAPFRNIRAGDTIAFAFANMPRIIVHRVTSVIRENGSAACITRGDNSMGYDAWKVTGTSYIGKVLGINQGSPQ